MIRIHPFRAWRPVPDKAHLVASRSYLSYSEEKLREKLNGNPFSFLHVIHPEHGAGPQPDRQQRFSNVRRRWNEFIREGWCVRDEVPCVYIYEQDRRGIKSRGIIATVSVADYRGGRIKAHEHTLQNREELFKDYLDATGINAEPVLLAAQGSQGLDVALEGVRHQRPTYDFSTTDMTRHRLWVVSDPRTMEAIKRHFEGVGALYIADGHHRLASSARLAERSGAFADHPKAWCLAFIVPQEHLQIRNFDRAITSLGGIDTEEFLTNLRGIGPLEGLPGTPIIPPDHGTVAVCTRQGWFSLRLPEPLSTNPGDRLDAGLLSDLVLGPVLGIQDLRTDPHVRFVPGTAGPMELERMVQQGEAAVAFHLCPVSFEELKSVADAGGCMPPKSTWIEPKLWSGLTVYPLED